MLLQFFVERWRHIQENSIRFNRMSYFNSRNNIDAFFKFFSQIISVDGETFPKVVIKHSRKLRGNEPVLRSQLHAAFQMESVGSVWICLKENNRLSKHHSGFGAAQG